MTSYSDRKRIIGSRIKKEREDLGLSKNELLPKIYKSEKSHKMLTAWENGERLPDLDSIALMANLFNCDIGYLLGDYNERHYIAADICYRTGLSEKAVESLIRINSSSSGDDYLSYICKYISFLLEQNLLVHTIIDASSCVDTALEIEHYQNEVLPKLICSSKFDKHLGTLKMDAFDRDDAEKMYQSTRVRDEIKRLKDIYTAKHYYSENGAATAISDFIDYLEKQYKSDTK